MRNNYVNTLFLLLTFSPHMSFAQGTYPYPNTPELLDGLRHRCPEINETYIQQINEAGVIRDYAPAAAFSICELTTGGNHYKFYRLNQSEISCYQMVSVARGYQACWDKFLTAYLALGKSPNIDKVNTTFANWRTEACYKDLHNFRRYLQSRVFYNSGLKGDYDECFEKFGDKNRNPDYWSESRSRTEMDASRPPSSDRSSGAVNQPSPVPTQAPNPASVRQEPSSPTMNNERAPENTVESHRKSKGRIRKGSSLEISP